MNGRTMISNPPGVLVVRGGAIGDFVLTLPVLAALRRHFPGVRLEVLGYPHIAELALAGGLADAVRSIAAREVASLFAHRGEIPTGLAQYLDKFALIISYLYDPDRLFEQNVRLCSRAQFVSGPHRPDDSQPVHATDTFLKPLERLAIFDADPVPRLDLPEAPTPAAVPRSGRLPASSPAGGKDETSWLAVHPGSGSDRKNWPEAKWNALLPQLAAASGWNLLLAGGEAEGGRLERLAVGWPAGRRKVARNLPLVDLARRMRGCSFFLGHDSGITHLAAALGLPGLVLWGHTPHRVWRPRSERMTLLEATGGLETLQIGEVFERVLHELEARAAFPF